MRTVIIEDCCILNQSPVSVVKGCIVRTDDGKPAIELTLKNDTEKKISAVGVRINLYDTDGKQLGNTIKCWYKKLNASQGKEFGSNNRIPVLAEADTFRMEIGAAVFVDGEVWKADTMLSEKINTAIVEDKIEVIQTEVPEPEISPEELQKLAEEKAAKAARTKKIMTKVGIGAGGVIIVAAAVFLAIKVVIPQSKYNNAVALMESGSFDEASAAFLALGDYKDAVSKISECRELKQESDYNNAVSLMNAGDYESASSAFSVLNGYKDSNDRIMKCKEQIQADKYSKAISAMSSGDYLGAKGLFAELGDYNDCADQLKECDYQLAAIALKDKDYETAAALFDDLGEYKDSRDQSKEANYQVALAFYNAKQFDSSNEIFEQLGDYKDSAKKIHVHEYKDEVTTEPTCTETGIRTYSCSCGKQYSEDVPALGHSYSQETITQQPTCTTAGSKTLTCRCGDSKTETIPATGHTYTSAVTKEPTCTLPGVMTYTCHCGDSYTETIPTSGHRFDNATCWEPRHCSVCGYTEGKELGHTTKKGYCARCHMYIRDGEEWDSMADWEDANGYGSDYDEDWWW